MSFMKSFKVSLAFVGLLVGAGFATGQEVFQYFVSFGVNGIWAALFSGAIVAVSGAVMLQAGSYYLADDHKRVFKNISTPLVSKVLDGAISVTLFVVGSVMLAGAGSTLEQQFGIPSWMGAAVMALLVMGTGMLNVNRVSDIISWITPAIIIAVTFAFIYTMFNLPADFQVVNDIASQAESAVEPAWFAAVNNASLAVMMGVSMCVVIGGNTPNLREARWGGLLGGALFTGLLLMLFVILLLNVEHIGNAEVPMLMFFETIHPVLSIVMVAVVYAMIYNTAIGMFYALGRRLTARRRSLTRPMILFTCLAGYVVSFFGFGSLINYLFPILGYIGILLVVVLIVWWAKHRRAIRKETKRRNRIQTLLNYRADPRGVFAEHHAAELKALTRESKAGSTIVIEAFETETPTDHPREVAQPQPKY